MKGENDMNLAQMGQRIKNSRQNKHLTQEEFSEKIGVSPHYIYEIERGSKAMSIHTFYNVVTTLSVSADFLLYGHEPPFQDDSFQASDELLSLLEQISPQKRKSINNIIHALLPYIK